MRNCRKISGLWGLLLVLLAIDLLPRAAHADDWIFRRSYYSHVPEGLEPGEPLPYPVPVSRSAYRPAIVNDHPGFSVRGGYRRNFVVLRNRYGTDFTVRHEGWLDINP